MNLRTKSIESKEDTKNVLAERLARWVWDARIEARSQQQHKQQQDEPSSTARAHLSSVTAAETIAAPETMDAKFKKPAAGSGITPAGLRALDWHARAADLEDSAQAAWVAQTISRHSSWTSVVSDPRITQYIHLKPEREVWAKDVFLLNHYKEKIPTGISSPSRQLPSLRIEKAPASTLLRPSSPKSLSATSRLEKTMSLAMKGKLSLDDYEASASEVTAALKKFHVGTLFNLSEAAIGARTR